MTAGYEKDPARVAAEAVKQAARSGCNVVLVDTAGACSTFSIAKLNWAEIEGNVSEAGAAEAVKQAARSGCNIVLVGTAGEAMELGFFLWQDIDASSSSEIYVDAASLPAAEKAKQAAQYGGDAVR